MFQSAKRQTTRHAKLLSVRNIFSLLIRQSMRSDVRGNCGMTWRLVDLIAVTEMNVLRAEKLYAQIHFA